MPLAVVAREWTRIGVLGLGGPPAHIRLLRNRCVRERRWIDDAEFEHAIATCNMLPGPASTQLAIFCAWRVAGPVGALVGGVGFILPGFVLILLLASLFLAAHVPVLLAGAAAGAGAGVAALAAHAGWTLAVPSWHRRRHAMRWSGYLVLGALASAAAGSWVVLVLLGAGLLELLAQGAWRPRGRGALVFVPPMVGSVGPLGAIAWVALKVGALSYGGGFVIIPLMRADAVDRYHWLTPARFLSVVALGQVTPGPVVLTVAAVGFAAAGIVGAILATVVAFGPSFCFILLGAPQFDRLRDDPRARAFLDGSGPAAIGAILGSALPLARALEHGWQFGVLGVAAVAMFVLRRGVVVTLAGAAGLGIVVALLGLPVA